MMNTNTNLCSYTKMAYVTNNSYLYKSYTNVCQSNIIDVIDSGLYEVMDEYSDYCEVKVYDSVHKILFSGWISENTINSNIVIKRIPLMESNLSTVIVNINKNSRIIKIVNKKCSWIKIKSKNNNVGWIYKDKFKFVGGDLW
ncbi:MAG: hypothetical protein PHP92_03370 [Candidatus Nanoarchaeia archaeon]|nr:hypothetical protein [Candidatus Nanoarchaeia archaeon]